MILDRELEDRLRQCMVTQHGEPVLACDLSTAQGMFTELEALLPQFAMRDASKRPSMAFVTFTREESD